MSTIYTIGHSTLPLDQFIEHLKRYGVTLLVDVRTSAWSYRAPWATYLNLQDKLPKSGCAYEHQGYPLGGKKAHVPVVSRLRGLRDLAKRAESTTICLMCAEGDPMRCHRGRDLTPLLESEGVEVCHILPDGRLRE